MKKYFLLFAVTVVSVRADISVGWDSGPQDAPNQWYELSASASSSVSGVELTIYANGSYQSGSSGNYETWCGSSYWDDPNSQNVHFTAHAQNGESETADDNVTIRPDEQAPSIPTGLAIAFTFYNGFRLTWQPSTDNVGVSGYNLIWSPWVSPGQANVPDDSTTYDLTGLQANVTYTVQVRAYDANGNYSAYASFQTTFTPGPPVLIIEQPSSQFAFVGATPGFSVVALGAPPLSYQWKKNGTAIAGATGSALSLPNVQSDHAASYTVVVSNSAGSATSSAAALSVMTSLASQSKILNSGANITYTVGAWSPSALTFQWRKNGTTVSGATNSSLALTNVQSSDAASYSVMVAGGLSDTATLTVIGAITPAAQSVSANANISFSTTVAGPLSSSYQWRRNLTPIAGATGLTLSLANVQPSVAGTYSLLVSNSSGSGSTPGALLVVSNPLNNSDTDGDGAPDRIEAFFETQSGAAAQSDSSNSLQLKTHRPQP